MDRAAQHSMDCRVFVCAGNVFKYVSHPLWLGVVKELDETHGLQKSSASRVAQASVFSCGGVRLAGWSRYNYVDSVWEESKCGW